MPAPTVDRRSDTSKYAIFALTMGLLSILLASCVLLSAFGFAITNDALKSNPNYSKAYEQSTARGADVTADLFFMISLLPAALLGSVLALRWPKRKILLWLGCYPLAIVASYACTLIWLTGVAPDFVYAAESAVRRIILMWIDTSVVR